MKKFLQITSYQVGRVRLSPSASPHPTAPPKLQPRSQASRKKPGLKTISQDFKREALALDKEQKLRLLSHPRSGTARKKPQANAAMESRESALPGILPRVLHYENIDILQHPSEENLPQSEENLPQPGIAGPRVPRPDAAVPASPGCVALGLRLSSRSYHPNRVNGKGSPDKGKTSPIPRPKNPPDGTAVSRLKASIPRPLHSSPLTLNSSLFAQSALPFALRASPDGSHPARPKQKQRVRLFPDFLRAFVGSDAPRQAAKL